MIGNDIIDLEAAAIESNWHRKGFLDKLFHSTEQSRILEHRDPNMMVWLLWSIKESAYKIIHRRSARRQFNPLAFKVEIVCVDLNQVSGLAYYDDEQIFTQSNIIASLIDTVAVTDFSHFDFVRDVEENHQLYKKQGVPFLDQSYQIPASVSHHGRYSRSVYLMNAEFVL